MKTDKELADELDARKRLEGHGLRRMTCERCHGVGDIHVGEGYGMCFSCEGKGYKWESPMVRAFREARESITPESTKRARDGVDKAMKRAAVQIRKMNRQLEGPKP